jgi:hypothetical protein
MFLLLESIAAGLSSTCFLFSPFCYLPVFIRGTTLIPIPLAVLCTIIRTCFVFFVMFSGGEPGHREQNLFSIPSSLKSTCSFSFYVATLYKASVEYGADISDRYEHGQWFDPVVIIPF